MADPLIDPESWEMMKSQTDPEFLAELIEVYLSDSPELIEQMRRGLAAGDCDTVRRSAHTLKSNSASFGEARVVYGYSATHLGDPPLLNVELFDKDNQKLSEFHAWNPLIPFRQGLAIDGTNPCIPKIMKIA